MKVASPQLTLLIPGLLPAFAGGRAPRLERWLARADREPAVADGTHALLFQLFGINAGDAPPLAPVSLLGEGRDPGEAYWLRADPVVLEADQAQVFLIGNRHLNLAPAEVEQLVAELNALLAEDGCLLVAPHPRRWYLRLPQPPDLRTHPLHEALGSALQHFHPEGADRPLWQRRITEWQMLLHASPVNAEREGRGEPTVTSLWLWGGGHRPQSVPCQWTDVWSDAPLARGLARLGAVADHDVPESVDVWLDGLAPGNHLLFLDGLEEARWYGDRPAWETALEALEERWLAPVEAVLRAGRLASVYLLPGGGRSFTLGRRSLRRWWRRSRPLESG